MLSYQNQLGEYRGGPGGEGASPWGKRGWDEASGSGVQGTVRRGGVAERRGELRGWEAGRGALLEPQW